MGLEGILLNLELQEGKTSVSALCLMQVLQGQQIQLTLGIDDTPQKFFISDESRWLPLSQALPKAEVNSHEADFSVDLYVCPCLPASSLELLRTSS